MSRLDGQVALVTGAARGIGRSAAILLAQEGAAVVINDLDEAPLRETAAEIERFGGRVHALAASVTSDDFPDAALAAALEAFGRIDILVNNAGYGWSDRVDRTKDDQWQAMLDVHLTAPFRTVRRIVRYWRETGYEPVHAGTQRKIVNVSSVYGTHGASGHVGYSAAKSGVVGFTLSLARELGPEQINVNAVAFGLIETRLTQLVSRDAPVEVRILDQTVRLGAPQEALAAAKSRIPLRRGGSAEEAAGGILLLCLPEANFISGQIVEIDGGMAI